MKLNPELLSTIPLQPYDDDPRAHPSIDVLESGLLVVRRLDPETKQRLVVVGVKHPHHNPDDPLLWDIEKEWRDLNESVGPTWEFETIVEGRIPSLRIGDLKMPGTRPPMVDARNRSEVIKAHGDAGVPAHLARLSFRLLSSTEQPYNEREIALHLEKQGYDRLHIMRYYLYRQIPQWFRTDPALRPPLLEYIQIEVIERHKKALQDAWPDFVFTFKNIADKSTWMIEQLQNKLDEREVEHFLVESTNMQITIANSRHKSSIREVAEAYQPIRTRHFTHLFTKGWKEPPYRHKFCMAGAMHIIAMSEELAKLGIKV